MKESSTITFNNLASLAFSLCSNSQNVGIGITTQSENLEYWRGFSIRTTKERPDHKGKKENYDWQDLPELGKD